MDSSLARCRVVDGYQHRLTLFLVDVRWRSEVSTVVLHDLWPLLERPRPLYQGASSLY